MVVALDEGGYLPFEIIRQEVVLEQDAVLQRLMPALDFALGLIFGTAQSFVLRES